MNTRDFVAHRKMLAIIIGVAIFATAGVTVASAQVQGSTGQTGQQPPQIQGTINLQQSIMSNVKTSFSDAANTAASKITNGKVIGGSLTLMQGYVVYIFKVVDDKNMTYSVVIDPANGSVLYTSPGHEMKFSGFGMWHGGMNGGFKHGGHGWNKQTPSGSTPPTGSITPSSGT
jgi:uncharacterized membrane protein YkoI